MKNVFVVCISNDSRGVKVVFVNFIKRLLSKMNDETHYYLFCSWDDILSYRSENISVVITRKKNITDVLFHDRIFLRNWSVEKNIFANVIVSMQNTTIKYFKGIKQIVLFQQSVPLSDEKWNPFLKSERILFYYKNIYPYFVKRFITKETIFIAPTKWVKDKLATKLKIPPENVITIYSEVKYVDKEKIIAVELEKDCSCFFYPSNGSKHKNHLIIINALKIMRDELKLDISKIRIYFTLNYDRRNFVVKAIDKYLLKQNFVFTGILSYSEMNSYYKGSNVLLFPSLIESFGLPLIEAAQFGLPILTVDIPYAREVLQKYNGAFYLPANDPLAWAHEISNCVSGNFRFKPYEIKFDTGLDDFINLIHDCI